MVFKTINYKHNGKTMNNNVETRISNLPLTRNAQFAKIKNTCKKCIAIFMLGMCSQRRTQTTFHFMP